MATLAPPHTSFCTLLSSISVLSDISPQLRHLAKRAMDTLQQSLQPRTQMAYQQQFRLYLAFNWFVGNSNLQDVYALLAFMQYLLDSGISGNTISNYISAIKCSMAMFAIDTKIFDDLRVSKMLKAIKTVTRIPPTLKSIISPDILTDIVQACSILQYPALFRALFLVAFYTFLRISNFAVSSSKAFDPSRHFVVKDFVDSPQPHLLVKWEKNLQNAVQPRVVYLPRISSLICPVKALRELKALNRPSSNAPLFATPAGDPVTFQCVRQSLAAVLQHLGLSPTHFTFHSFRRSGATFAFNSNLPVPMIQAHGGWKSTAVLRYIQPDARASSLVSQKFQNLLS